MLVVEARRGLRIVCSFLLASTIVFAQDADLAAESHHARELMAERRFSEAIPIYEKLVKAVPGNPGLLLNLGLAEEMAGQPARAIPHFESVLATQPDNLPALLEVSVARMQLNRSREALPGLRKVLKLDPQNRNALGLLADAELDQHLYEEAATHYRELTVSETTDPRAWYGLGKAYEALASKTFTRLNQSAPESAYVAVLLADTRLERRQYRSAFFFYRQAEQKATTLPGVHSGLANVYRQTDHPDWASQEDSLEQQRATPDCTSHAAQCDFTAKRFVAAARRAEGNAPGETLFWATKAYNQLAVEAFQHLSSLPESVQIHVLQAQILRDHKQQKEAAAEWQAATKLAPDDADLKQQWAAAVFDAKDYTAAMPLLAELLSHNPDSADLNYLMGASLFRTEQIEKALPYLRRAVAKRDDNPAADAALGLTLVAANKNEEAVPYLKKALTLDDDGSVHYSLARAYRSAGQTQLAAQALQEYQKIQQRNQQINDQLARDAEISAPRH